MMDEEDAMLVSLALTYYSFIIMMKKGMCRRKRKVWSRKWLQRRSENTTVLALLDNELRLEDPMAYRNFLRMTNSQFEQLLHSVETDIRKEDTNMREAVSARNRLEVTLRFLATGESFRSLMYSTRIHESTISRFVPEVCRALYQRLGQKYLRTPKREAEWKKIAEEYYSQWNFPHCIGALDGRHITFRAPISDGSYYFNYKGEHSIVLLGLVDANYRFVYVNVGVNGRISDGGVFSQSNLCMALKNEKLHLPSADILPGHSQELPYVIVADDAFPLLENLMKPYPHRGLSYEELIFNYRLSRARRVVENSFGILVNRFRVLLNPINLSASKTELITLTCVVLHNFLTTENASLYTEMSTEGTCSTKLPQLSSLGRQSGNFSPLAARNIRESFKNFFNSVGAVPWQDNAVRNSNM